VEIFLSCPGEWFLAPAASGNDTDGRHAGTAEPFVLAARHPDADPAIISLADDKSLNAARADEFAAVVGPRLDVADVCPDRDLPERQGVSILYLGSRTPGDSIPDTEPFGGEHVDLLAVLESGESDRRMPCRVVLDIDDLTHGWSGIRPGVP
jgi:hypothetical protein